MDLWKSNDGRFQRVHHHGARALARSIGGLAMLKLKLRDAAALARQVESERWPAQRTDDTNRAGASHA